MVCGIWVLRVRVATGRMVFDVTTASMRCHRAFRKVSASALAALFGCGVVLAQQFGPTTPNEPILTTIQIPNLPLGVVTFPNGKAMNLTVALGSGAFRSPADAPGKLWLVTDRGPAIACADAKRLIGIEPEAACGGSKEGSLYPLPGFVPSIYGIEIGQDFSARITTVLPLKGKSGRPVSGRPTPASTGPKAEPVFSVDGKGLPLDPTGINPEALVRLSDGTFWLADTFGPSLVEVGPDGTVRRRLVPAGAGDDFKDGDAEIVASLPGLLRQRRAGQGFRALALSPDEREIYAMMATPLAVPDAASTAGSRQFRLFRIERASGAVVSSALYLAEPVERFNADNEGRPRSQSDVRVVEMANVGPNRLLVMEQVDKSSRLFLVTLDEASRIPPAFETPEARPSLEALDPAGLGVAGLVPLDKAPVLESEKTPGLPARIEGFAILSPSELVAINDNDFGIEGVRTQMFRIMLPALPAEAHLNGKAREDKARSGEKK